MVFERNQRGIKYRVRGEMLLASSEPGSRVVSAHHDRQPKRRSVDTKLQRLVRAAVQDGELEVQLGAIRLEQQFCSADRPRKRDLLVRRRVFQECREICAVHGSLFLGVYPKTIIVLMHEVVC